MPSSKWTPQYIEKLKELFPRASKETLQEAIPGISWTIIKRKAGQLGIKRDLSYVHKHLRKKGSFNEWSSEDLLDLQRMYEKSLKDDLISRFSNRSYTEVKRKAASLGLKRDMKVAYAGRPHVRDDSWSEEEHTLLCQLYAQEEFAEDFYKKFRAQFPRTIKAIYSRIKIKKLFSLRSTQLKSRAGNYWSAEDLIFLEENYETMSFAELEGKLDRPRKSIWNKASSLGLKRPKELFWREGMWSKEDLECLYEMWPKEDISDIFDRFPDRKYDSIKRKASEAGITRLIKNSTSEIIMKRLLDEIFPGEEVLDNKRYDWLRSKTTGAKMELDRYYPELKLAFEYDGEQHFSSEAFYRIAQTRGQEITEEQSQKEWELYIKNDQDKKDICQELGIKLINIKYADELDEELIRGLL